MTKLNSKTLARIAAVQAVYQYSLSNFEENIEKIHSNIQNFYGQRDLQEDMGYEDENLKFKLHKNFYKKIFDSFIENREIVDEEVKKHLSQEWNFDNLHENLKSIVRCGVTEILFLKEVPGKVIVSEYTDLSSEMLKQTEIGFVNSMLDKVKSEIRENET